jgi:predicted transcriptional regulator
MAKINEQSLAGLFGSESACHVLLFLENYEKGYASEIARTFGSSLSQMQNQLNKFEQLGILVSRLEGTSRVFYFKQNPLTDALREFLKRMLSQMPEETLTKYYRQRRRPRRQGKPI